MKNVKLDLLAFYWSNILSQITNVNRLIHAQYSLQNVPRWICWSVSLVHQERDLSSDCVRGPVSTAASAGDGEVPHCSPVSQIPDSWACRARDQEGENWRVGVRLNYNTTENHKHQKLIVFHHLSFWVKQCKEIYHTFYMQRIFQILFAHVTGSSDAM